MSEQEYIATLDYVDRMLTNMQPHIEQSCTKEGAVFIDSYVDAVIYRVRAEIKAIESKGAME